MNRKRTIILLVVGTLFLVLAGLGFTFLRGDALWLDWAPLQSVRSVEAGANLRDRNVGDVDLRNRGDILRTCGFNLRTAWPASDRLPAGFNPGETLTNAMNPGLRVRELHRQGITGKGVAVAIIDFPVLRRHAEFSDAIEEVHAFGGATGPSMHGPAVASLLVGKNCGVAPGARLYFMATPDPGRDASNMAEALDWIVEKNKTLPKTDRIRAVSVSASPSGPGSPYVNGKTWDEAVARAERSGVLVIDAVLSHGFLGPCNLDPNAPDEVARCSPIPTQRGAKLFAGRLLVPVAPRTVAEEWSAKRTGYIYCGWMEHTHGFFGTSWSMPYCAGVLAMGWQVNPEIPAQRMKELLFDSAYLLAGGEKVINPVAFIEAVRKEKNGA